MLTMVLLTNFQFGLYFKIFNLVIEAIQGIKTGFKPPSLEMLGEMAPLI